MIVQEQSFSKVIFQVEACESNALEPFSLYREYSSSQRDLRLSRPLSIIIIFLELGFWGFASLFQMFAA